jgi:hypothetical protein
LDPALNQELHRLDQEFPQLRASGALKTSDASTRYNCIAWAVHETRCKWWPLVGAGEKEFFWPHGVPRKATVDNFTAAFRTRGFAECADGVPEAGFEKIALYVDASGTPTHAARLKSNGRWTSKLGGNVDIEHDLHDVEGGIYGAVARFYRKALEPPPGVSERS